MLCSRCTLPVLALYLLLEEISAHVLPSRFRNKREVSWLDQDLFSHLPERTHGGDLSVGDAGETGRDIDGRPSHSETFLPPTDHLSVQHQHHHHQNHQNHQHHQHHQHQRKANEKKRKVAPLDSIGSFKMSSFQNRKDEPDVNWEDDRD